MLIMFSLIALFIICGLHVKILHEKKYKESIQVINYLCMVITGITIIIATTLIVKANVLAEYSFAEKVHDKYAIGHSYEAYVFPELAQLKKEKFNAELKAYKQFAESPWTNWFCNQYIAEMDYIDLEVNENEALD